MDVIEKEQPNFTDEQKIGLSSVLRKIHPNVAWRFVREAEPKPSTVGQLKNHMRIAIQLGSIAPLLPVCGKKVVR